MISYFQPLYDKISTHHATICVVGLGYVGQPLISRFLQCRFNVIGIDIDLVKIQKLKNEFPNSHFTTDFSAIHDADVIIICVPTPLNHGHLPDLGPLKHAINSIQLHLKKGQLICLESTTYPFTTKEEIINPIRLFGHKPGFDLFFGYSPERIDPGNDKYPIHLTPKVVAGETDNCIKLVSLLYGKIVTEVVPVSSIETAEFTKILENTQRAVNVSLINELKIVADKMNIDIWEAIDAASTKPFGFTPYFPGPGSGGHCIPVDPFYLTFKAKQFGVHTRFVELAGQINDEMPAWIVGKITFALSKFQKPISGAKVLILGLAYKKNIDDCRESPAFKIISLLHQNQAACFHHDPFFHKQHFSNSTEVASIDCDNIKNFDCIVIVTDHDCFDYSLIQKHAITIIDTRNVYKGKHPNVVRA